LVLFAHARHNQDQSGFTYYAPSIPVSVVGCIQRYQFCNVPESRCTALSGMRTAQSGLDALALNTKQSGTIRWLMNAGWSFGDASLYLGSPWMLFTQHYCNDGFCIPVPDNQWVLELANFLSIALVNAQQAIVNSVRGFGNPEYDKWIQAPDANDRWMCNNQITKRNDYSSFNVLGLALILSIGGLLILVNLTLEPIMGAIQARTGRWTPQCLEWMLLDVLQLQRMTFEGRNLGTWSELTASVPVNTMSGEKFALPTVEMPKREQTPQSPRFRRSSTWSFLSKKNVRVTEVEQQTLDGASSAADTSESPLTTTAKSFAPEQHQIPQVPEDPETQSVTLSSSPVQPETPRQSSEVFHAAPEHLPKDSEDGKSTT
jgi:hypothetical protein